MRQALLLLLISVAVFVGTSLIYGYGVAYTMAYGAVVTMAVSISATFFWLWHSRATPLALGMGFSWSGTAGVLGWWWIYSLLEAPEAMNENVMLFLFVAAYFVGAILHFRVVANALGWWSVILLAPLAGGACFALLGLAA